MKTFEDWWNLCRPDVYKNVLSHQWGWVRQYTEAAWKHGYKSAQHNLRRQDDQRNICEEKGYHQFKMGKRPKCVICGHTVSPSD